MKRSGPPKRVTRLARSPMGPRLRKVRQANPDRRKREWVRSFGSAERVAFVQGLACTVPYCSQPSENAHVGPKGKGAGRRANADQIAPLCKGHHRHLLHQKGIEAFTALTGVTSEMLLQAAEATEAGWKAYCGEMSP